MSLTERRKEDPFALLTPAPPSFDVHRPGNQKNVEILCATALSMLLMFGSSVPSKSLDTLMANFHPQVKRSNPSAAHLAALVAQGAVNELQAPAAQVSEVNRLYSAKSSLTHSMHHPSIYRSTSPTHCAKRSGAAARKSAMRACMLPT